MAVQLKNAIAIAALLLCFLLGPDFSVSAQNHGTATYYTPPHVLLQTLQHLRALGSMWRAVEQWGALTGLPRGVPIDLSQEAFASIADPNSRAINISFQLISRTGNSTNVSPSYSSIVQQ